MPNSVEKQTEFFVFLCNIMVAIVCDMRLNRVECVFLFRVLLVLSCVNKCNDY